jgi:hypothetical protein
MIDAIQAGKAELTTAQPGDMSDLLIMKGHRGHNAMTIIGSGGLDFITRGKRSR